MNTIFYVTLYAGLRHRTSLEKANKDVHVEFLQFLKDLYLVCLCLMP